MFPKVIAAAVLSAIAIAASGCLGDSDAEAESPPTTTGQAETQPPAQPAVDIAKFRAAFEETFGERPWYGQITGMKMGRITTTNKVSRTLEITMKLDPEREVDVGTICHAAFTVAENLGVRDRVEAVHVFGSDGSDGGCA